MRPTPPLTVRRAQKFKNDVLGRYKGLEFSRELDQDDLRHGGIKGLSTHRQGHIKTAGSDREHAKPAIGRGMAVGSEEGLAGFPKSLKMNLMADPVSRARKHNPVSGCNRLEVTMVIRIFEPGLQHIMVDIGDGQLGLDMIETQGFKLEVGHRPSRILRQRLVNLDRNFLSGDHFSGNQVVLDDFLSQVKRHCLISLGDVSTLSGIMKPSLIR
ncbi:MAG: hypothetical protein D084_Lepto4C00659G0001 [Leptospirillum sp. Group IV 'UBA BS']|nr:MAG: hypothetical protein D084_Lepto4C00659G0001 [Leptospirillum sp. Group IV 'UBA BS']